MKISTMATLSDKYSEPGSFRTFSWCNPSKLLVPISNPHHSNYNNIQPRLQITEFKTQPSYKKDNIIPPSLSTAHRLLTYSPFPMASVGTLSGSGGGISGLLRLRRQPISLAPATSLSFSTTIHSSSSLSEGGNLLSGRNLRPELVLEPNLLNPFRHTRLIAACAASTPAEGGDSAG
jgi:hypothetical protein